MSRNINLIKQMMKKNLQIHVRVTPATRRQWDELCEESKFNTQSALFRKAVKKMYKKKLKSNEIDDTKL